MQTPPPRASIPATILSFGLSLWLVKFWWALEKTAGVLAFRAALVVALPVLAYVLFTTPGPHKKNQVIFGTVISLVIGVVAAFVVGQLLGWKQYHGGEVPL
jgi:hypothetical protein